MRQLNTYQSIYRQDTDANLENGIMMIVKGIEMAKIKYDLKTIMHHTYSIHLRLKIIIGNNPHPTDQLSICVTKVYRDVSRKYRS